MNIKVKCTGKGCKPDSEKCLTIGKIYEWEDGKLICDDGYTFTSMVEGTDPSKWKLSDWYTFEVVEEEQAAEEAVSIPKEEHREEPPKEPQALKFKVGARVRAIGKVDGLDLAGKKGTIIGMVKVSDGTGIGVEFDEPILDYGHSCGGRGKYGYCRFGTESEFELLPEHKPKFEIGRIYECFYSKGHPLNGIIVITGIIDATEDREECFEYDVVEGMKGDVTTKVFGGESGFARHLTPLDDYIVKEKASPEQSPEPPKAEPKTEYFNGKMKCIKTGYSWWKVGKVYEVNNGYVKDDNGCTYPNPQYVKAGKVTPFTDAEDARFIGNHKHNEENEFIPVEE